jgi:hypothetical protein
LYLSSGQTVELVYTGDVALSFESGMIRTLIDNGLMTASFNFGSTFNSGLGSVGITGNHQAIDNPTSAQDLADFFDTNFRPTFSTEPTAYTLYVDAAGDDDANDGTVGSPFATVERALQKVAQLNSTLSTATISIGAGSFAIPQVLEANFTNFQGTLTTIDTLTVSTVVVVSNADGIVLDVTSTGGPYGVDDLQGVRIKWTSGASVDDTGWIYRNGATVLGVTRIYATRDTGASTGVTSGTIAVGNTIDTKSLDTELSLAGSTVFQGSVQLNIRDCLFTATATTVLSCLVTDKVDFSGCYFDGSTSFRKIVVGGMGRAFFTDCYYAGNGDFGSEAFLSVRNNGFLLISRGTVLDASVATSTRRWVEVAAGSLLAFSHHVVCRGFTIGRVFEADGSGIFLTRGIEASAVLLMEDANGTSTTQVGPIFRINSTGKGLGGWYQTPNLHGSITATYAVEAEACACVALGTTSSVGTGSVTNAVSADSGTTATSADATGTVIKNGSPTAQTTAVRYTRSFTNSDLVAGVLTVTHNTGNRYVVVAVYSNTSVQVTPDTVTATSTTVCTIDLSSQGVLTGTWNLSLVG